MVWSVSGLCARVFKKRPAAIHGGRRPRGESGSAGRCVSKKERERPSFSTTSALSLLHALLSFAPCLARASNTVVRSSLSSQTTPSTRSARAGRPGLSARVSGTRPAGVPSHAHGANFAIPSLSSSNERERECVAPSPAALPRPAHGVAAPHSTRPDGHPSKFRSGGRRRLPVTRPRRPRTRRAGRAPRRRAPPPQRRPRRPPLPLPSWAARPAGACPACSARPPPTRPCRLRHHGWAVAVAVAVGVKAVTGPTLPRRHHRRPRPRPLPPPPPPRPRRLPPPRLCPPPPRTRPWRRSCAWWPSCPPPSRPPWPAARTAPRSWRW